MLITYRGVMDMILFDHYSNLGNNITPQNGVIKRNLGVIGHYPK